MAAGLKVWRDSQWMGALVMGSVKRDVLLGVMTGALVGRVKGASCQLDEGGLAAARRGMLRGAAERRGDLLVRMRLPVSFIMSGEVISCIACRLWITTHENWRRPSGD